jgi:hypothetical protein
MALVCCFCYCSIFTHLLADKKWIFASLKICMCSSVPQMENLNFCYMDVNYVETLVDHPNITWVLYPGNNHSALVAIDLLTHVKSVNSVSSLGFPYFWWEGVWDFPLSCVLLWILNKLDWSLNFKPEKSSRTE